MENHYFDHTHPLRPYTHSLPAMPGTVAPDNALRKEPPAGMAGFHAAEKNGEWVYIEDHREEEGFLNGEPCVIQDYGPYPDGWSFEMPEPTVTQAKEMKWAEIVAGQASIMARVKSAYPSDEREGWPFKLFEAEAILAGSEEPMPYIDAECQGAARLYSSRLELARKVMANNDRFKSVSGFINGQQTVMYHDLEALCSSEGVRAGEILALPVSYVLPDSL